MFHTYYCVTNKEIQRYLQNSVLLPLLYPWLLKLHSTYVLWESFECN